MSAPTPADGTSRGRKLKPERRFQILIADDHAIVRRGLQLIISDAFPEAVFGEAANSTEALALVEEQEWDVILLDISMPGRSGLEVLRQLKRERPGVPVLVLSVHPEDQYGVHVLSAGAAGFLNKESASELIVAALRKVLAGGKHLSESLAGRLADAVSSGANTPLERLSDRELEVLRLIGSGKSVKGISSELNLSAKTVSTYRVRLLRKLKLDNSAELIRYALERRLVH